MRKQIGRYIIQFLVIAAVYAGIMIIQDSTVGMTRGFFQIRVSEALTVLPVFTPAAIPGLFVGRLVSGYFMLGVTQKSFVYDIVFGSLATLVAAFGTFLIRKQKFLAPVPPIIINMIVTPLLFTYVYRFDDHSLLSYVIAIGFGELIACGVLGIALMLGLEDHRDKLFPTGISKNKEQSETAENTQDKPGDTATVNTTEVTTENTATGDKINV